MYYTKIHIKVKEHLPMYLDREILLATEDFHTVANKLYEQWSHHRCVFMYRRIVCHKEFFLYAVSKESENMSPFAEAFMDQYDGKIADMTVTDVSRQEFEEALARSIFLGFLKNGKAICAQMEVNAE